MVNPIAADAYYVGVPSSVMTVIEAVGIYLALNFNLNFETAKGSNVVVERARGTESQS